MLTVGISGRLSGTWTLKATDLGLETHHQAYYLASLLLLEFFRIALLY
jgi:hypothetical protein